MSEDTYTPEPGLNADDAVKLWNNFKGEQPEIALALSVLPVSGQVTAAIEYYDAMQRGDTADGIKAAIQFGLGPLGAKAGKALIGAGELAKAKARENIFSGANMAAAGGDMRLASKMYATQKAAGTRAIYQGAGAVGAAEAGQVAPDVAGYFQGYEGGSQSRDRR